jgi:predicted  nucleic acid-binding Zn-ribbon protein
MAKTSIDTPVLEAEKAEKKERLRQAKREAKIMLRLQQAKAKVQEAEKKVAKNQSRLETMKNKVSVLEERLAQAKNTSEEHG